METSAFAQWLDTAFSGFDFSLLNFYHLLETHASAFATPVAEFVSLLGEKGVFGFLIALVLLLFKKTRKCGLCMIVAVGFGAVFTNLILKEWIARMRPYAASEIFREWWQAVGSPTESDFSFPSGHVTAAMAAMTALWLGLGKKWIAPAAVYVALMAASRNYLMVHYPSDVLAGCLVGGVAAVLAFFAVKLGYRILERYRSNRLFRFWLESDVRNLFSKKTPS